MRQQDTIYQRTLAFLNAFPKAESGEFSFSTFFLKSERLSALVERVNLVHYLAMLGGILKRSCNTCVTSLGKGFTLFCSPCRISNLSPQIVLFPWSVTWVNLNQLANK